MTHQNTSNSPTVRAARRIRLGRQKHHKAFTARTTRAPYAGRGPSPSQVLAAKRDAERLEGHDVYEREPDPDVYADEFPADDFDG